MLVNFITDNGNGKYYICEDFDPLYKETKDTNLIVPPKQTNDHKWDNNLKQWIAPDPKPKIVEKAIRKMTEEDNQLIKIGMIENYDKFVAANNRIPNSVEELLYFIQNQQEEIKTEFGKDEIIEARKMIKENVTKELDRMQKYLIYGLMNEEYKTQLIAYYNQLKVIINSATPEYETQPGCPAFALEDFDPSVWAVRVRSNY